MQRTQIYLTAAEKQALAELAQRSGRTQNELIREAIDAYLARQTDGLRRQKLRQPAGMWRDREDLPDFEALRREMDRS